MLWDLIRPEHLEGSVFGLFVAALLFWQRALKALRIALRWLTRREQETSLPGHVTQKELEEHKTNDNGRFEALMKRLDDHRQEDATQFKEILHSMDANFSSMRHEIFTSARDTHRRIDDILLKLSTHGAD